MQIVEVKVFFEASSVMASFIKEKDEWELHLSNSPLSQLEKTNGLMNVIENYLNKEQV